MQSYFPSVPSIPYEGKHSQNPLAFHHYDPKAMIGGKPMKEHLRFSVAYWHTFCAQGDDMFGSEAWDRPWNRFSDPLDAAKAKADAAFEFFTKLGVEYFCTHDRDLIEQADTIRESNRRLDQIVGYIQPLMKSTGVKLLWGTANLFHHPRFLHGAATSCSAEVYAYGAAQVKKMLEITKELQGENFVFWGGREGYETLLNTRMDFQLKNLARFLSMAVDYAQEIGFAGQFLIEPKPKEPTKHQYDFDVAHGMAFLKTFGLDEHFKFNIEANHATLAGHSFQHELMYARIFEKLGSVDANMGDLLLGWDTDHFPTNLYDTIFAMIEILKNGGLHSGGLNFDAHLRRGSIDLEDIFIGHIAGMDAFARGLKIAYRILQDGRFEAILQKRYESWNSDLGRAILENRHNMKTLEEVMMDLPVYAKGSGKQEQLEHMLNDYLSE